MWKKFDEIDLSMFYLYTESETWVDIFDESKIEDFMERWESEEQTLTNLEIQEIVEAYESELCERKDKVIEKLRTQIKELTKLSNVVRLTDRDGNKLDYLSENVEQPQTECFYTCTKEGEVCHCQDFAENKNTEDDYSII